jgi:hypothetical protein
MDPLMGPSANALSSLRFDGSAHDRWNRRSRFRIQRLQSAEYASGSNRPMLRDWYYSFLHLHELTNKLRNVICFGIKSEVSCVENVNLSVRYIPAISLRL